MTCWDFLTVSPQNLLKNTADLQGEMQRAFGEYIADVAERRYPALEHMVDMPDEEWQSLLDDIATDKPK